MVVELIGDKTFTHYEYEKISGYLLINNATENVAKKEKELISMFRANYLDLLDMD